MPKGQGASNNLLSKFKKPLQPLNANLTWSQETMVVKLFSQVVSL